MFDGTFKYSRPGSQVVLSDVTLASSELHSDTLPGDLAPDPSTLTIPFLISVEANLFDRHATD